MARLKLSLGGFADPIRRPRWIIWTVVGIVVFVGITVPVLGLTSTRWFCSNGCHKVQDDTIRAYEHSTHSQISCMACHMPVDGNPLVFMLHKMEALGELAQAVTNNYELPLNKEDEVALKMSSTQCLQCHDESKRKVTPTVGLRINHQIHSEKGVNCTVCHNRVAHKEDFQPTLTDPKSGERNQKHANFMTMTACFRCHTQDAVKGAPPGQCFLCHTTEFPLLPASHQDPKFFPKGHGRLAAKEETRAPWLNAVETTPGLAAEAGEESGKQELEGESLRKIDEINQCSTCHARAFCTDCHGVPMPHPKNFQKTHGAFGRANPQVCTKCHGFNADFCSNCHHGTHLKYTIDSKRTWKQQHFVAERQVGAASCVQPMGCHSPTYCATCHANGGTPPAGGPKL